MERLGTMYRYGRGVEKNSTEALKWYKLALDQGYTYVIRDLAALHQQGLPVVENDAELAKWRQMAVKRYDAASQHFLDETQKARSAEGE